MKTEITQEQLIEMYNGALNCEGEVMGFERSDILEKMDPIAYRCGLNDFYDSLTYDNYYCEEME
jgi:hypothetical protein